MNHKILKEDAKNYRALVAWERGKDIVHPSGVEYSVHMISLSGNLICGRYFNELEDAEAYYNKVIS